MSISWKDVAHYGTAGLAIAVGGAAEVGVQIPGVVVSDPKMTVAFGIGILAAGLKSGWSSGVKAVLIGGAIVLGLSGTPADAADLKLPTKALSFQAYPTNGCGAYYGVNALGSASPIANATPGATAIGGDVGGTLGYTCATSASTFWFAEVMADFQNLNGSGPGFSLTGPAHIEERVAFGGPINQLLNVLPNINLPAVPSLPSLPSGITAGPTNGYVYAAINEDDVSASFAGATGRDWIISPEVGVGMLSRLSNNVVADVWAGARLQSQEVCVGGFSCPKLSTGLVTGLAFKY